MTGYKSPPARPRSKFVPSTALNTICLGLACRYQGGESWAAIGREIGVPGIVVYRAVVHQKYPRNRKYRRALGLVKSRPGRLAQRSRKLALDVLRIIYG